MVAKPTLKDGHNQAGRQFLPESLRGVFEVDLSLLGSCSKTLSSPSSSEDVSRWCLAICSGNAGGCRVEGGLFVFRLTQLVGWLGSAVDM